MAIGVRLKMWKVKYLVAVGVPIMVAYETVFGLM